MTLSVIGAGFGRTGTLSLKFALEKLGYDKCYHMMELRHHPDHQALWSAAHLGEPMNWDALFEGYQATVDWPSCNLWESLADNYPEAKVILSLRDPEKWYDSVMNTIYASSSERLHSADPVNQASGQWAMDIIWNRLFDGRMEDRQHVIDAFNRHNDAVIQKVPASRLLVFEATHGWQGLCPFLDKPIPEDPYPRVNSTEDFRSIWHKQPSD